MSGLLYLIDNLSTWVGKAFGWCIIILVFGTCYEVFVRYVLSDPTYWALDMGIQMYGTLFIMGGAYTLARNGHVRGDVLYRLTPVRVQASIDLTLYFIFFFPAMVAMVIYGYGYAAESWRIEEVSWNSPARIQIYYFKTLMPIAAALLIVQGIGECLRCIVCLATGEWPVRTHDVEETETLLMSRHIDNDGDGDVPVKEIV